MVELDDGSLALVLGPNPADPARPSVRMRRDAAGAMLEGADAVEYRPLPESRTVRRALTFAEYPRDDDAGETPQAA
jgi:hypothetical protein